MELKRDAGHGQRRSGTTRAPARAGPYPAEKARGGEIILNTPLRRWVFVGGLVGAAVPALLLSLVH
jgi:hypothetical protein